MTENKHYFVQFFTEVKHVFNTKLVASYNVIILLRPKILIKSTTSDVAELRIKRCAPAGIHWSPIAITFCLRQHAVFLFNTKLNRVNNLKINLKQPFNHRNKIPSTWCTITRICKCFDRRFQSMCTCII